MEQEVPYLVQIHIIVAWQLQHLFLLPKSVEVEGFWRLGRDKDELFYSIIDYLQTVLIGQTLWHRLLLNHHNFRCSLLLQLDVVVIIHCEVGEAPFPFDHFPSYAESVEVSNFLSVVSLSIPISLTFLVQLQ